MPGSCCRIAKACRTESIRRRRSRSFLKGSRGVSLRRFSQTCRDLVRDPGALFSPKPIIFPQSPMMRRQFHEGNAGRLPGTLQTKAAAETRLTPRASAAKTASPRLAGWKRFEQRLGHLCGPIDGVSIAVNPRDDEAPCISLMSISASLLASSRLAISPSAWAFWRAPTWSFSTLFSIRQRVSLQQVTPVVDTRLAISAITPMPRFVCGEYRAGSTTSFMALFNRALPAQLRQRSQASLPSRPRPS
jgi:hypothetical protein